MVRSIDEAPDVRAARAALEPIAQRQIQLEARLRHYTRVLDPHALYPPNVSEADVLEAQSNIVATRIEHAKATLALRQAESELMRVREAERERIQRAAFARKRLLVQKLDAALRAAAAVNTELSLLEQQARDATNAHTAEPIMWSELLPSSALQESRLDVWRRSARDYGLLDD
jgi:hypothetical protein